MDPETAPDDTTPDPAGDSQPPGTPSTTGPTGESDKDWQAEAEKWKALSRKHEDANTKLLKQNDELKSAAMSDAEKAIADAVERGRTEAMSSMRTELAEARLRAAAAGKVADVDALMDFVDLGKFVTENGVDDAAITAAVDRFAKVAPAPTPPKFGSVDLGPQGDRPRQLGEADLARMTPEQIVEARQKGQLDELMGVTS